AASPAANCPVSLPRWLLSGASNAAASVRSVRAAQAMTSSRPMRPAAPLIATRIVIASVPALYSCASGFAAHQPKKRLALSSQEASCGLCLPPPAARLSRSSCSIFFCLLVRLTGVSTATLHSRSPGALVRTDCTPLPRRRKVRPLCVSGGTRSDTLPFRVGTSSVPPSAAVTMSTGTVQRRLLPSRVNSSCGRTLICTYKSPGGPPCSPDSPSPLRRMRSPLSTPAGTLTDSVLLVCTRPWPRHFLHGSRTTLPSPRQSGQVCWMDRKPCCRRTWPLPLQVGHSSTEEPGSAPEP